MALSTLKSNRLTPLGLKGLNGFECVVAGSAVVGKMRSKI